MTKILSFHNIETNEGNPSLFKRLWMTISSLDSFTKMLIVTNILIIIATPAIISQYFDIRNKAKTAALTSDLASSHESVPNEILLKFKSGIPEKEKEEILRSNGLRSKEIIPHIETIRADITSENEIDALIDKLKNDERILYAEKNYLAKQLDIPNDPFFPKQWDLEKMQMVKAWDTTQGSPNTSVGVIDSGIDKNHDDIKSNLIEGYNFIDNTTDTMDQTGHGTIVAGIIGATTNNEMGIASVGWKTSIMPLKVVNDERDASYANIARALVYATDHKINVINISLGGKYFSNTVQDAIQYAWVNKVLITAAVGNEGTDGIAFPAAAQNVIAVGASNSNNTTAYFSNSGSELDILAPGEQVYSLQMPNDYSVFSGTSIASAQVAAAASLLLNVKPNMSTQQIVDSITGARIKNQNAWSRSTGWGVLNVFSSMQTLLSLPADLPDTVKPLLAVTYPSAGSTVSNNTTIQVSAFDNIAINKVEMYIDKKLVASTEVPPYTFLWNTTTVTNGLHIILVKAYDASGNSSDTSDIPIVVNNVSEQ